MLRSGKFWRSFPTACAQVCCWNCHEAVKGPSCEFFCKNCHSLLPLSVEDYFDLFKQPKTYAIDLTKLEQTYKSYQRQIHPDNFFTSSEQELAAASGVSRCVNEGYKALSDPISRGEYLLTIFKEKAFGDVPQDFLIEVMEIHQNLETSENPVALKSILVSVEKRLSEFKKELTVALMVTNGKLQNPTAATEILAKMKYLSKIRDKVREKLPVDFL
jgi:molecular chaperone HscB